MESPQDLVPEHWPAERSDVPAALWYVRGLLALPSMVLLWLLPKTMGVRLCAAGWLSAVAAHVLGVTLGAGLIVWAEVLPELNPFGDAPRSFYNAASELRRPKTPIHEYLTAPFAALVTVIHAAAVPRGWGIEHLIIAVVGLEAAMAILTIALMAFATAGERAGLLFGRCLRLTWWSTTLLIPLGVGFLLDPIVRKKLELPDRWMIFDYGRLALFGVWWLLVWVRSGFRYSGPPEGPAWQPRTPTCEGCGYTIVGIPITTRCPECNRLIQDSLPWHRRSPLIEDRRWGFSRFRPFPSTCRAVVMNHAFFRQLAVHQGYEGARSFFFAVCAINSTVAVLLSSSFRHLFFSGDGNFWYGIILASSFAIGQVIVGGLIAGLSTWIRRISVRAAAIITFYGLTSFFHFTGSALIIILLVVPLSESLTHHRGGWFASLAGLALWFMLVGVTLLLFVGLRCTIRAFLQTKRAQG